MPCVPGCSWQGGLWTSDGSWQVAIDACTICERHEYHTDHGIGWRNRVRTWVGFSIGHFLSCVPLFSILPLQMMTRHRHKLLHLRSACCLIKCWSKLCVEHNWWPSMLCCDLSTILFWHWSDKQDCFDLSVFSFLWPLCFWKSSQNNYQQRQRVIMIITPETNILLKEYVLVSFVACIVIMFIARVSVWYCTICVFFLCAKAI